MNNELLKSVGLVTISLIFFSNFILAQEAKVEIKHFGSGRTPNEAYFTIHNVGEVTITNVTIFIDGERFKTIKTLLPPGEGFETILYLDQGNYHIEVRTPEGAYDSIDVNIPTLLKQRSDTTITSTTMLTTMTEFQKEKRSDRYAVWIIFPITLIAIIAWFIARKLNGERREK